MTKHSTKTLMLIPVFAIAMIAGTATQVMAIGDNDEASVKVGTVELKNQGFYEVRLLISSGTEDLAAGKILVTSDVSSKEVNFDAILAESTTDVRTIIKVNDRSSVDAKLINIDTKSTAKIVDVIPVVDGEASVKVGTVELKNQGFYEVHLLVSSGSEDLIAGKILVTSDVSSKEVNFAAVPSESTGDVRTIIKANDRGSIDAKLINIDDKPTAKLVKVISIADGEVDLHRATVMVKAGSDAIRNVKLLLESDMESLLIFTDPARTSSDVNRVFSSYSDGLTTANIHAMDSESISVKLASYDNLR